MRFHTSLSHLTILLLVFLLGTTPAAAIYEYEGIPFRTVAQGEIEGEIISTGTFGLSEPPVEYDFDLPGKPVWSRVYTGIWGGTEKYSGWVDLTINGEGVQRFTLSGESDEQPEVYATSHGVYWVAYDATDVLKSGGNAVVVETSRGEAGNKLDGRIYAVLVVAAVESNTGTVTQFWIAEGNENIHGEGWAGANPTIKDEARIILDRSRADSLLSAELDVLLLATNSGQPDYVQFNGVDLGVDEGNGVRDIGNEQSLDAEGDPGYPSRYVDFERFDVSSLVEESNEIVFLRGRDLDGDGTLATSGSTIEAEDYLHPVMAILTLTKQSTVLVPEYGIERIDIQNAYTGEEATAVVEIRNYGGYSADPCTVEFTRDGKAIARVPCNVDRSGIGVASASWPAEEGTHTITATVYCNSDADSSNNRISQEIKTGSLPDLTLEIQAPYRSGDVKEHATESPLMIVPLVTGIVVAAILLRRHPPGSLLILMLVCGMVALPLLAPPSEAAGGFSEYVLPVEVRNIGGSDAGQCAITIYLDGEKTAIKMIEGGVPAGGTREITVPLFTGEGEHHVRVVIDEDETIREQNTANNQDVGYFEFT